MCLKQKQPLVQLSLAGRIGEWLKKNQGDIVLVIGFVLVAIISFGLGYISAPKPEKDPLIIEEPQKNTVNREEVMGSQAGEAAISQTMTNEKGLIVASKNSKIYHWPWCAPAKKIKAENQIWFKSEAEAQATGFSACADFEKLAPVGYKKSQ